MYWQDSVILPQIFSAKSRHIPHSILEHYSAQGAPFCGQSRTSRFYNPQDLSWLPREHIIHWPRAHVMRTGQCGSGDMRDVTGETMTEGICFANSFATRAWPSAFMCMSPRFINNREPFVLISFRSTSVGSIQRMPCLRQIWDMRLFG